MLTIEAIPAFNDNYIWALCNPRNRCCVVVDPGDAAPVQQYLAQHHLHLSAILITHHHPDHVGGVATLRADNPDNLIVFGPIHSPYPGIDTRVGAGDVVELEALDCAFDVLAIPGHTLDHIAYHNALHLFCGDTLFAGGCGRLFEGTPAQMQQSLNQLCQLDDDCQVFCAHEYTEANLQFAITIEPDNLALRERLNHVIAQRLKNEITIPSTIGIEKQTNPFLRAHLPSLQTFAAKQLRSDEATALATFTLIRQLKDNFSPPSSTEKGVV